MYNDPVPFGQTSRLCHGRSWLRRISVGIETFEQAALDSLPYHKQQARQRFDELLSWCQQTSIEMNCFIVVGLPGTTPAGTRATFEYLNKPGVRLRPSIYSDYSCFVQT